MSDLLISWLNDEVQLSKRITNFEEDFHNGYLFGELLSKYSQQLNFNDFVDKDDKASRIKNFTLLYDTLKTLRVSFDSNIAMNIIQKNTGIAKKVLYELKMQLQKTTSNSFNKTSKPTKPLSPLKKIPIPKEKFDKISKEHFSKQLNQIHSAQKSINLQSHLLKFSQFHHKQIQIAEVEERKQAQARLLGQMKFRERQIQNTKKSAQFIKDWQQSNAQKWAANMAIRKLQQQKDNLFKTKLQTTKIQNKTVSQLNAIKSLDKDLKQFEKKALKKQSKKDSSQSSSSSSNQKEKADKIQTQKVALLKKSSYKFKSSSQSGFGVGTIEGKTNLSGTGQFDDDVRRKKNPLQVEAARHYRQKRRRKMIVQQSKKHHLIKIDRRQKYIISTLQQTSKQQKQIEYQIWRAWQNKEVIIENKKSFNDKIKQKQQTRVLNAKFKDQQLVKTFREEHQKQLKDGLQRQNKLKTHNSVKQRKKVYDQCKQIIQSFISMTEVVYEYAQQKNQEQLDEVFLTHLLDQFVQSAKNKKQIAEIQLNNYIHGKGQWKIQIKRGPEQQIVQPTEENSLPNTVVNNYYLGNILKTVFKQLYHQTTEQRVETVKSENFVALLGLQFAGKNIISGHIRQQFGFNVISIPDLIYERLQQYQTLRSKGLEIDGETAELVEYCFNGKSIPNSIIVNLIKQNVQKNQKSLVINYPITYEQCIQFTKVFGGAQPSDYSSKSKLKQKIDEFSRLVWPTDTKIIERSLKPCGLDFALWIDISPKTSLDRYLGRRWNHFNEVVHINEQISNPNVLRVGQKGSSTILKNDFKLKNKSQIENWLNQFGIKVTQNGQELIQRCWQTISGECSIEQLSQRVFQILKSNIDLKNKKKLQQKLDIEAKKEKEIKQQQRIKFQEQLKAKCALSTNEYIKQRFKRAMDSVKMDPKFLESIQKLWNNTEKLTINGFLNVFQTLRDQEEAKNKHISNTKLNYLRMLTREDERFFLVKKFQNQYNKFIDENNDMVIQQFTKEELHQRIQDLQLDLLTLIEQKKQDAITERQNIMKSGWLQSQLDQIMSCIHILLQIQLNRSFACQQIIGDFYSKKFLVNTGEIQEAPNQLNVDNQLEIIKENTYPRLEKLVSESIRIFNRQEEVVQDKNKKGGKVPPPKKDDKKQAKKGGKQQVEQKTEPTLQQKQYKKALNTQKAIFRYRVRVISAFASKKLKEFQEAGLKLYSELQDLYKYTDKIENRSAIQMTKIFKKAIQQQRKIENQVQINYTDVIQSEAIRNFKKPKPIILPAVEKIESNRFTISAMKEMIKLFKNQSEAGASIKNNRLLTLLQELSINQRYRTLLPTTWKNLTKPQHQRFVANFDKAGKGQIQLWIIFTIIALSNCYLPSQSQIKQYELQISDHNPLLKEVDVIKMQNAKSWFDSTQPQVQNTRFFDRNKYLKQILFTIFKKQDGSQRVVLDKYLSRVTMTSGRDLKIEGSVTYFDYAFPGQEN